MTGKDLMNGMNFVDDKYIQDAEFKTATAFEERSLFMEKQNKTVWKKWVAVAACLCVVIAGVLSWQFGLFEPKEKTVTLKSGEVLAFREIDGVASSSMVDIDAEINAVTAEEIKAVFGDLPIKDCVKYTNKDGKFMGLEGKYEDMKFVVEMPGEQMRDTMIVSSVNGTFKDEETGYICGIFVTDPNSKGEKDVIYSVDIQKMENCKIYIEGAGKEEEREQTEAKIATAVENILASRPFDFSSFAK